MHEHSMQSDVHPQWQSQSDHYSFIQAGVPSLYFGVEDHEDYHQVSDEVEKIIPALVARVARLVFASTIVAQDEL